MSEQYVETYLIIPLSLRISLLYKIERDDADIVFLPFMPFCALPKLSVVERGHH